jgi:hypothetical protein
MSREQLIEEVKNPPWHSRAPRQQAMSLLAAPRAWGLLPEKQDPLPVVPRAQFIRGCVRYRQSQTRVGAEGATLIGAVRSLSSMGRSGGEHPYAWNGPDHVVASSPRVLATLW